MSGGSFSFLPAGFTAMADEVTARAGADFPEACKRIETLCVQLEQATRLLDRHLAGDEVVTENEVLSELEK